MDAGAVEGVEGRGDVGWCGGMRVRMSWCGGVEWKWKGELGRRVVIVLASIPWLLN